MHTITALQIVVTYQNFREEGRDLNDELHMAVMHAEAHLLRRDFIEPYICAEGHIEYAFTEKIAQAYPAMFNGYEDPDECN